MGYEIKETFIFKHGKNYNWNIDNNRLNQVGKKGSAIIGASTDINRQLYETNPSNIIYVNFTTGNDSTGTGTSLNPFKTYIRAVYAWSVGKTIEWMDGTDFLDVPQKPTQAALSTKPKFKPGGNIGGFYTNTGWGNHKHGQVTFQDKIFLFGGYTGATYSNASLKYDFENKWISGTDTSKPTARQDFAMVAINNQYIVLFGGYNGTNQNDTYHLTSLTGSWSAISPTGTIPSIRSLMAYCENGSELVIFGGVGAAYYNDVYTYNPSTEIWTQKTPTGTPPSLRAGSCMVYDSDNDNYYIFGGFNLSTYYNDIFKLEGDFSAYTTLSPSGTPPTGRAELTGVYHDGKIYFYGGKNASTSYNTIFVYDISGNSWDVIYTNYSASSGQIAEHRYSIYKDTVFYTRGSVINTQNLKSLSIAWTAEVFCGFEFENNYKSIQTAYLLNCTFNNNTIYQLPNYENTINDYLIKCFCENNINIESYINTPILGKAVPEYNIKYNDFVNLTWDGFFENDLQIKNNFLKLISWYLELTNFILNENCIKCSGIIELSSNDPLQTFTINSNTLDIYNFLIFNFQDILPTHQIRDNIIEIGNLMSGAFGGNYATIESGNVRGSLVFFTTTSDVSTADPLFWNPSQDNYDLQRKASGFQSDSLLIGKSIYSTFTYLTIVYPNDLGCYHVNDKTIQITWDDVLNWPLPKNFNLSHQKRFDKKFAITRSGRPDIKNNPENITELIQMNFQSLDREYLGFLERLQDRSDLSVFLSLNSGIEEAPTFTTSGIQAAGSFILNITGSDIPKGAHFIYNEITYWIVNRDTETGNANVLVLNRALLESIPNATVIQTAEQAGLGEFKYLIEDLDLVQAFSKNPEYRTGLTLTFIRKKDV